MIERISILILCLLIGACSSQQRVKESNGFISDFTFDPRQLEKEGYVKGFKTAFGDSTESEEMDYLIKAIIEDSLSIGFGYHREYNRPLFHFVQVRNLALDSASLSSWLSKMHLVMLSNYKDVDNMNYFFVQSNDNGLVYIGSKTLQEYGKISFTAHLPLAEDSPVRRKVKTDCVLYHTATSELCFNN